MPFSASISTVVNVEFNVHGYGGSVDERGNRAGKNYKISVPFSLSRPSGRLEQSQFGSIGTQVIRSRCLTEDGYLPEILNVGHAGTTTLNSREAEVTIVEISNTSFDGVLVHALGQPIILEFKWRSYSGSSS
ncbi:MAG: hypothetical protein F6K53_20050 [Moorea sp. SIO4A1]|uniref:hypothetical protein n=1 Tax=Moorena sp. SIO4A1 TaxID=2607835 RepID=UPI0014181276|nr:hypothetical protein [Moorena sp. SIO4A1]NEO43307.1 hypothetical protein [Moorena sp. SIO4A3]NEQ59564.1 hypothetical protein [Moorena sp. SIO4A1]